MSKKLVLMAVVVMAMASVSFGVNAYVGFNSNEDLPVVGPAYTLGEINGQGSTNGDWDGAWTASSLGKIAVAAGGCPDDPDQHLAMYGAISSSYHADRNLDIFTGDFTLSLCLRLSADADGRRDQTQIQLKDTTGADSGRPLNIKLGGSSTGTVPNKFIMNDQDMVIQSGDPLFPNIVPLGTAAENWARIMITCEAATATYKLYWENTLGGMDYIGTHVGNKGASFNGNVRELEIYAPKTYTSSPGYLGVGMDVDAIHIVPEPMTMVLLGLGGLSLIRRKR
jgi:hypothetical protein